MASGGIGNQSPATLFQARLSTVDGVSNVLTLARYQGNKVVVAGVTVLIPSAGLTRDIADNLIDASGADAGGAPAASTFYYVYISSARASFSPSSIRLSATVPTLVNGVLYLGSSGNARNWRFVGWVQPNATPQFESQQAYRGIVNQYNRIKARLFTCPGYVNDSADTSYALNSATWVQANGGTGSRVFFIANGEDSVSFSVTVGGAYSGSTDRAVAVGIAIDSLTNVAIGPHVTAPVTQIRVTVSGFDEFTLSEGGHTADLMLVGGPVTIPADFSGEGADADTPATFMSGSVLV